MSEDIGARYWWSTASDLRHVPTLKVPSASSGDGVKQRTSMFRSPWISKSIRPLGPKCGVSYEPLFQVLWRSKCTEPPKVSSYARPRKKSEKTPSPSTPTPANGRSAAAHAISTSQFSATAVSTSNAEAKACKEAFGLLCSQR